MKLALLTALTMTAFAANSVLNRAAVGSGSIDAASFALIRVIAGIVILCMVLSVRGTPLPLFRRARCRWRPIWRGFRCPMWCWMQGWAR